MKNKNIFIPLILACLFVIANVSCGNGSVKQPEAAVVKSDSVKKEVKDSVPQEALCFVHRPANRRQELRPEPRLQGQGPAAVRPDQDGDKVAAQLGTTFP